MTLDNGIDSAFAFGVQSGDMLSRDIDLIAEGVSLGLAFSILRGGAFTFARQTFSLNTETLERAFELTRDFAQPLSDRRVLEQIRSRSLDFGFRFRGYCQLLGV